ncbi:sigma-54-dependent Fis family transcriptional regulator, partial [Candidatus Falkowbacteria bacterium]|nr:sigma-54-dependent Fis family transcriptional regulator [Candidatus Falkowbacteria bacterium]
MDGTVLVADDDRTIRTVLTQALTRAGCKVHATSSLMTLMRWIEEGKGDLVISDVMMPDGNGLEALPRIGKERPGLPVIVISAQNTIMTAIQAAEAEAYDYLPKPFDLPDLMKRAARALDRKRRAAPLRPAEPREVGSDLPLVGRTPAMQALLNNIALVAPSDATVLIHGESGTGKELVARALHASSARRDKPLVTLNCAALNESLLESELFGHEKGAFTGADRRREGRFVEADGGTLFLDEIGDITPLMQVRLL